MILRALLWMLAAGGTVVTFDGLSSRAPAEWKPMPASSGMRVHQFTLPRMGADKADAELIIFYFGPGGGGDAESNVARWKSMFEPPAGKSIEEVSKVQTFKVGSVKVTYVDITGTYLFKVRPVDPALTAEKRPGHRMIGVVFESPKGPYFMRLVGPEKTVTHYKGGFDSWLKAFR